MFGFAQKTRELKSAGRTIRTGLVGAGQMGTDIVSEVSLMPSQEIIIIADVDGDRAARAYEIGGYPVNTVVRSHDLPETERALAAGHVVAVTDYRHVTDSAPVEAVIEATGSPEASARTGLRTLYRGKHLVTLSVEMDITVGPLMGWYARQKGVVYTLAAGDEPTALYELYDFAASLGLTIVAAGKGKNNPLNRDATPDELAAEAARRGLTPEMLVEFVDGSKTMIEMASVANATGLVPDIRGMHGPKVNIKDFKTVFATEAQGGVLRRTGVVDYVIGDLAPGVFLVFTTDHPRLKEALVLRDMGHGPNYVLLRPFHLCSIEVPLSVLDAVLNSRATMPTGSRLVAEVLSVAKRNLLPGDVLERIGGRTHFGMTDRAEVAAAEGALPIGIARDAIVRKPVQKGEVITFDAVELPSDSLVVELRRLQDRWADGRIDESFLLEELDRLAAG